MDPAVRGRTETSHQLLTRIKEHLVSDKNSHTCKQLSKNSNCKNNSPPDYTSFSTTWYVDVLKSQSINSFDK